MHIDAESAISHKAIDGERLLAVFSGLVEPLGRSLPPSSEVVLHDLSKLPNSIVAVYGDVTGRQAGDPATDLLLKGMASEHFDGAVGYETRTPDGRRLRSSTMIVRDDSGEPVLAICINSDLSIWESMRRISAQMMGGDFSESMTHGAAERADQATNLQTSGGDSSPAARDVVSEAFAHDLDELAAAMIYEAIREIGMPIERMRKKQKIEVVRKLKTRGLFTLRNAIEVIASALGVTRFTIYNYLNELNESDMAAKEQT